MLDWIGQTSVNAVRELVLLASIAVGAIVQGLRPRSWRRTTYRVLLRSILNFGVASMPLICFLALVVGLLIVVQYQVWVGSVIESKYLSRVFVAVVLRELGPLLVNLTVVGRSGSSMASELGLMTSLGEVRALDAQGLDPLVCLIMPRVYGFVISVICLTIIFFGVSLAGGYLCGQWFHAKTGSFLDLAGQVMLAAGPTELVSTILKATIPPWLAATICCTEGMRVGRDITVVPSTTARAVQRAMIVVVLISGVISALTYL
jgi:phospholipid/cholesterol/gamma-HCH transport system permease protein